MPIYEYRCATCRNLQEEIRPMGAGTEGIKCNRCGGTELEKVLSVIARTRAVATGSEPCEVSGGCPMGGCGHGCGELD